MFELPTIAGKEHKNPINFIRKWRGNLCISMSAKSVKSDFNCGLVWPDELVAHKQAVVSERVQRQLVAAAEEEARQRPVEVAVR